MLRVKLHFQSTLDIGKMKVYYWTIFFCVCFFVNTTQGLYLTHPLVRMENLPYHLERFGRSIFEQRLTRSDRFVSSKTCTMPKYIYILIFEIHLSLQLAGFMNPFTVPVQSCRTLDCILDEMFHIKRIRLIH